MGAEDLARRVIGAWREEGVDGVLPLVHPEFVGEVGPETSVEPDTYLGAEGVRRYFALWDEAMDDLRLEIASLEAVAETVAVAELTIAGRGAGSGVPVEFTAWTTMVFRDELLLRMEAAGDRDGARRVAEAAGG